MVKKYSRTCPPQCGSYLKRKANVLYKICVFLTSALVGGDWSLSRPGFFTPNGKSFWYSLERRGWVGPRVGLDDMERREILPRAVGIAIFHGLDSRWVRVRVSVRARFSALHVIQTGHGAHPTSCPMATGPSFPGGEAAGAWSSPLAFKYWWGQKYLDLQILSLIRLHGIMLN
jgi:hypothetical protein